MVHTIRWLEGSCQNVKCGKAACDINRSTWRDDVVRQEMQLVGEEKLFDICEKGKGCVG